jgi:hypothetical protein
MENERIKNKNIAKEKILLFIIGVLVGAVISTAAFFVYTKTLGTSSNTNDSSRQMPGGTPPEMPSGQNNQGGTPPEMPSNENASNGNTNTSSEEPSSNSNSDNN